MTKINAQDHDIKRLQDNLLSIRRIAGWTAEELGDKIGVTKQTISNLENGKTTMTLTQYIAIRAILDYEVNTNKENAILPEVVHILLDKEFDEEDYHDVSDKIAAVSASAAGGTSGASLTSLFKSVMGEARTLGTSVASSVLSWMSKTAAKVDKKINDEDKNTNDEKNMDK